MASTATKRIWYANYACEKNGDFPEVTILGKINREVQPDSVPFWEALSQVLELNGYTAVSVGTYNCRPITGGTKLSLHAYGIAVDIDPYALGNGYYSGLSVFSWSKTKFTPAQVKAVEAIRTKNGKQAFRWGGWWTSSRDYMHWEIDVSPADLKTGLDITTVQGGGIIGGDSIVLKKGDLNAAVAEIQKALGDLYGYDNGDFTPHAGRSLFDGRAPFKAGEDGDFGTTCETNVKAFQKGLGLTQTGIVDGVLASLILAGWGNVGSGLTQLAGDARYVRRGINQTIKFP